MRGAIADMKKMPTMWRLSELLARHRVSGKELAKYLGCSENTVSKWRNSETLPEIGGERLDAIAAAITTLSQVGGVVRGVDLLEDR
jgi:putative transcriptional regulator